jgi:hypothetical protein
MAFRFAPILTILILSGGSIQTPAQTADIFDPPDPVSFYINTRFVIDGSHGYVPSYDEDVVWSFSSESGEILDPDGLSYSGQTAGGALFPGSRLALRGWFPERGILVVDVSDPGDLSEIGFIPFPPGSNIQGQPIAVDRGGCIGYVASFLDDTLYSFNVETLALEDPDGLLLPGNPDRMALSGHLLAIADTSHGDIIVADVSDPKDLAYVGTIDLPPGTSFNSDDNIVFAGDGRTGFISSSERVLFSFDIVTLSVLGALPFGTGNSGLSIAIHEDTVACVWSNGLAFIDVSDPRSLSLISDADFGTLVAMQGSATAAFSFEGSKAAIPTIFPGDDVYTFRVASGARLRSPFPVHENPNYLTVYGPDDRVGVICTAPGATDIWLIRGLLAGCETAGLAFQADSETTFGWSAPTALGCGSLYDVARGDLQALRVNRDLSDASCLPGENDDIDLVATDPEEPLSGGGYYYLSRVDAESWNSGTRSQRGDRDSSVTACP